MRVKRLEIQGFKSFKDKTVIHFDHGITGIVGPNGCGKSNIVDAFFWVMGEQSYKHMRGNSSEDLIFNGSSRYSPLGVAEATLVMETTAVDNENAPSGASAQDLAGHIKYKEVSVTRRLYRSGEGEYFINGVTARLKDIQELFMDTGVGAKGYSVIEQGQIGKIVNAKPEDRRLLIEEAAGIAKYKARKKESLRKMEATQSNLSRLNDVIQEIERSLGSLERQAQKARQYKKYKDELIDKEMTWGRRKILVLRQKTEALRAQKEALEQELTGLRAELQIAENSIEVDRVEQLTDNKAAEEFQAKIQDLADELAQERSALDLSRRRQSDLASQLETLENEKQELVTSIAEETQRLQEREDEGKSAEASFAEATRKAQAMDEDVRKVRQEAEGVRRQLEASKRELMNGISRSSELTSRAASLLTRMESAKAQAERLAQQVESHTEKLAAQRDEAEKTRIAAEEARMKREELQAARKEQGGQVQTQEQMLRQLEKERNQSLGSVTQLKSKLQSLEELASAYEGISDAPKAALDWAQSKGEGKLIPLAEALEVGAGFETAVEGWMEKRLENLITEQSELALQALQQVRNGRNGRIAIHVAPDTAKAGTDANKVKKALEEAGFEAVGPLTEFVKTNLSLTEGTQEIAMQAISQVYVVRSFDPMTAFLAGGAANLGKISGWSILSQDGSALDSCGMLRGGSAENDGAASLLRRKRAIADLKAQVSEADARHQEIEQKTADARQTLELARARLQALQGEVQALEIQVAGLDRDVHQMNRSAREAENQLENLQKQMIDLQEEAAQAAENRLKIEGELGEFTSFKSDLEARISQGDAEHAHRDAEIRIQEADLQALRVTEASLRERASSLKRELEAGRSLVRDREKRLNEIRRTLERASQEREQFTGGDSGLEERIEELTLALATNRQGLAAVKDRLEQSNAKANAAIERIKQLHKTGDQKTSDVNHLALDLEKLHGEATHLVQNLDEKYGPGCLDRPVAVPVQEEMQEPIVTAEISAEEEMLLGEEVERLRERIRRLGEVNVMAIEEFEELKKRYDYLVTERSDLEHSIDNLQEAIEHINKTSEERFRKAFEAIADRFERLFPIIFGGGQAKLSLVYPEGSTEILDAGVDILAQPPGKKIVNIGLLSGGEKALTAVSLIFAIFLVKPSPFCVLDEVDAPLDDANIGKFNALLREMSAKSQFILITHNKKTMELNDTLYGVTMEEPGVSKMVSIEMN